MNKLRFDWKEIIWRQFAKICLWETWFEQCIFELFVRKTCSIHNFRDAPLKNIIETVDKTKNWKLIWWKLSGKTKTLVRNTWEEHLAIANYLTTFWSSAEWSYVFGKKLFERILDNLRQQLCWRIRTGLDNGPFATLSELQTHPNLHSPIWVGRKEMTQIKHSRICSLTAGQDQPYRNKGTQHCTLSLGMTSVWAAQTGLYRFGWVWASLIHGAPRPRPKKMWCTCSKVVRWCFAPPSCETFGTTFSQA